MKPDYVDYVASIRQQRLSSPNRIKLSSLIPPTQSFSYTETESSFISAVNTGGYIYTGNVKVLSSIYPWMRPDLELMALEFSTIDRNRYIYLPETLIGTAAAGLVPMSASYNPASAYVVDYPSRIYLSPSSAEDFADNYGIDIGSEYSHNFLPGFLFTGKIVRLPSGKLLYEYIDNLGSYGPQYEIYLSTLRPINWDAPLGPYSELQLSNSLSSLVGSYPNSGTRELLGKYTGRKTNFTYHPSITYYEYERENGSLFLSEASPSISAGETSKNFLVLAGIERNGLSIKVGPSTTSLSMPVLSTADTLSFSR